MKHILIRKAQITDIPEMINLLCQLFSIEEDFSFNKTKHQQGLILLLKAKKIARVLVAEYDKKIIGMLTAQINISSAEGCLAATLEDMIIDKEYRRKGIGRKLLYSMQIWANKNGITRLQLLADKSNSSALQFYKTLDWQSTKLICLRKYTNLN